MARARQGGNTVVYYHTDALRSVSVVTDAQGNVRERTRYAPYGQVLNGPLRDGPAYTGHQEDAATGLVYAQQRYYDPESGRFLSVDPTHADANTGANFNRYWYASNNPYRYTDPDGRDAAWIQHAGGISTVVIPVEFRGSGATTENVVSILVKANAVTHPVPGVRVVVVATDRPVYGVLNTLTLSPGGNPSVCGLQGDCTNRIGGNQSFVNTALTNFAGAAVHEVFHEGGVDDAYLESEDSKPTHRVTKPKPGFDNSNIITSRSGSTLKASQITEIRKNDTTRHCEPVTGTHLKSC